MEHSDGVIGDPRVRRLVQGLASVEGMQAPPGSLDDTQVTALHQYLQTKLALGADDIIADIGSGLGMAASALSEVWGATRELPWYYAVDRAEPLERLAIPTRVHNKSRKVEFEQFLNRDFAVSAAQVRVVVLRNVLHEMDIPTTARVLRSAAENLTAESELYVQDIETLTWGERGKVGWDPALLREVLSRVGFDCTEPVRRAGKSGTRWFSLIARRVRAPASLATVERFVADARERQRQRLIADLQALNATPNEHTTPDYLILQAAEASLSTLLQQWNYEKDAVPPPEVQIVAGIPLVAIPLTSVDYAVEVMGQPAERSGLVAIISSKNRLDFPGMIAACRERVYFAGYSQRSLMLSEGNRLALGTALQAGADVHVLVCDPNSRAAAARAEAIAYSGLRDLTGDILQTIREFENFRESLLHMADGEEQYERCQIRMSTTIPSSSYFILDDLCYVSLYSLRLTGGTGPCLVFQNRPDEVNAYFGILLQDFRLAWDGSGGMKT